jgi:plastocyanin
VKAANRLALGRVYLVNVETGGLMRQLRITLLAAVGALLLVAPGQAGPARQGVAATSLKATVGPGFTISLTNAAGAKVTTLKSGVYSIAVSDKSSAHNFHLRGPGLSWVFTTVAFQGSKTIVMSLLPGSYTYVCDPHASSMKGAFKVS